MLLAGGVTLVSTAIRRRPNAFNFLHQCEMLLGVGASGESAIAGLTVPLPALYFSINKHNTCGTCHEQRK